VRSLFLKIFLWFWATVIATGIALILTFILEPRSVPSRWHDTLVTSARYAGTIAIQLAEREGAPAASAFIMQFERETHLKACLFDGAGSVITGDCDSFRTMAAHVANTRVSDFDIRFGIARVALELPGSSGREFIFATELPAGPRAAMGIDPRAVLLQWGVALLVSGFICYLLTRYLTTPILKLREASQQLANGNLSIRAAEGMERRQDELGDLVRDFNAMASRLEELVSRLRQLITDISHELRSPLARLNVALDLSRERKGNDPAFDQMEQDIGLLTEMISRLLTVARLDMSPSQVGMTPVDLSELAAQIVRDAEFESHERGGGVRLMADGQYLVKGNADLLHSAIENVIRNAIHYTEPGTSVEVDLQGHSQGDRPFVRLSVRDYGSGVPDSELASIFQPFYRVANARDRQSGGSGLGLAIAERVIRLHNGTIHAENAVPRGLRVEILLPRLVQSQSD
jgi:two-component system sensor histidine kinase CpxA